LTTSTNPDHIRENFAISPLPEDAMQEMRSDIETTFRLNAVVDTGVPGFVPKAG
jgi:diketogulonate reductase-like aldo/keto reductase